MKKSIDDRGEKIKIKKQGKMGAVAHTCILVTQEAETRRIAVGSSPGNKLRCHLNQ
jgi:hypothetical protein